MKENRVALIFDGDDTLWRTQELYDSAKAQFEKLMKDQGFTENNVIEQLDELDAKRVKITKFSKTRFFESMLIIYSILCGKYNKKLDISIESKIRELGISVFIPPKLYEDALLALEMLSRHFNLVLYTNGDKEIQVEKIGSLGESFKSYFSKIYICDMKNDYELRKIIDDLKIPIEKIWVVGNSVTSDINPALKTGLKCILIPHRTWRYEESALLSNDVIVTPSLIEAAKTIMNKERIHES